MPVFFCASICQNGKCLNFQAEWNRDKRHSYKFNMNWNEHIYEIQACDAYILCLLLYTFSASLNQVWFIPKTCSHFMIFMEKTDRILEMFALFMMMNYSLRFYTFHPFYYFIYAEEQQQHLIYTTSQYENIFHWNVGNCGTAIMPG